MYVGALMLKFSNYQARFFIMNHHSSNIRFIGGAAIKRTTKAAFIMLTAFLVLPVAISHGKEDRQQLWLINTRCAPLSGDLQAGQKSIHYWRLSSDCVWQHANEESFSTGSDADVSTTILIHGNRHDDDQAIGFAWPIYRRMLKNAQDKPFRLVIWSWPSEQIGRRTRPDVQLKFRYCDAQAYYLAAQLERLPEDMPLCLIGYSMGAKIAAAGLHLLAGGEVACQKLYKENASNQSNKHFASANMLMVSAAMDDDSLAADGTYSRAISQVDRILVVRNACDRALKWYPRIYGRRGPDALGFVGPAGCGEYQNIELLDVSCVVGKAHRWESYLSSCSLLEAIDRYIFKD